jgi:hypothetical protein
VLPFSLDINDAFSIIITEVKMKFVGVTLLLLIIPHFTWSFSNNSTGPSIDAYYDVRYTTFGQWQIPVTNWGAIGGCTDFYPGLWPRNSGHNYIFGAGTWAGGVIPNGDTLVSISYSPHDAGTEFAPGPAYSDPNDPQWRVYFSVDFDHPFPRISFEDGYAVFNDFDTLYHMPDTLHVPEPLGITITHKTNVWPKGWADDIVFIQTVVKNDTTYAIDDVYFGFCLDFDIGNEAGTGNDRCGIDLQRKLFYGWQEEMEPGSPPWRPGMLGLKLLSPCSLAAFKRFTLNLEPSWDWQRYMLMAGYNWISGAYEPYDTIWPAPDDQRILMTTGPVNPLAPGDSIVIDWALIAGNDSIPPSDDLNEKADKAQAFYDLGPHSVHLTHPSGSGIFSGLYRIGYTAQSITGAPLVADIYLFSEHGLDTVVLDLEYYGAYDWFTDSFPDCVLGRLYIMVFDTMCFGADMSDDYFTIDNPGNSPPFFRLLAPFNGETLSGEYEIMWFARDPEFQDSLFVNIFFKSQYDTTFHIVASNEPNDSIYTWNTVSYRNGSGTLIVEVHDDVFSLAETVSVYLLNEVSGGGMDHINGLNNCVNLDVLIHEPSQITGHTYELEFLEHRLLWSGGGYYPEYIYEITDSNTGITVLDTYSLKNGYTLGTNRLGINDFSPIIDGFSIHAYTDNDIIISLSNFHNDSVKVILGSYPEDSIYTASSLLRCWWVYRGSQIQLDWVTHANGGFTLLATDLDYSDTIPYKPYNHNNPDSAAGWCFNYSSIGTPSDTLRDNDIFIFLCGGVIEFKRTIPPPDSGDRWLVFPTSYSPPIKGNLYRFIPLRSISENARQSEPICFNVYPVPFVRNLTISYNILQKQRVKMVIYDVAGRQVKLLEDGVRDPGQYSLMWHGVDDKSRKVSSGVYFCRLVTGEREEYHETRKFILIKSDM